MRILVIFMALTFVAPAFAGESVSTEIEQLKKRLDERDQDFAELLRICRALSLKVEFANMPMRQAIEDYLSTRGVTGLALSDRELNSLDKVLRRITWSAELDVSYNSWDNALTLTEGERHLGFMLTKARLGLGFALVDGPELNFQLRANQGTDAAFTATTLSGLDPTMHLTERNELELFYAELRTEPFNLFGRFGHIPVTLIAGRQNLPTDTEFLLSLEQNRFGLSFDGVTLQHETGHGSRLNVYALRAVGGASQLATQIWSPADPTENVDIDIAGLTYETTGLLPDSNMTFQAFWTESSGVAGAAPYAAVPPVKLTTIAIESKTELTTETSVVLNLASQFGEIGVNNADSNLAGAITLNYKSKDASAKAFCAFGEGDDPSTPNNETFIPIGQKMTGLWDSEGLFSTRNAVIGGFSVSKVMGLYGLTIRATTGFAIDNSLPTGQFTDIGGNGEGNHIGEIYTLELTRTMQQNSESKVGLRYSYFDNGDYFAPTTSPMSMFTFTLLSKF